MEQHLVSRLRRILPAAALLLAVSCSKDEADIVQLPTPQTIEATPTETSLQLEWAAVEKASRYELQAGSETGYAFETVVEQPRYELTGLEPYSEYAVRVRAIVSAGNYSDSEWSAWTTFRTLDRTVAEAFDGGTGSEEEPYRISRPSHLALLAQVVNNRENGYCEPGVHYVLTGDLDLSRYDNWTPIGLGPEDGRYPYENPDRAFQGVFDGDGHTISGLKVELTGETTFTSAGLFGVNDGTIRNLNVAGSVHATTTAVDKSYVLAGGITGFNIIAYEDSMNTRPGSGAIESCTFRGSVSASCGPDTQGEADAGGICGMAESGNIDYCNVTLGDSDQLATAGGTVSMAGGIVGAMNGGRISHCSFNGTGSLECAFTAAPEGYYVYAQAGGIAGSVTDAAIESCNVEFGGTLRIPDGGAANCNAGLVCGNSGASVTDCFAKFSGNATIHSGGSINFGGIAGTLSGSSQGAMTLATAELGGTLTIGQTDNYSDVNVGGIYGSAASAVISACKASISAAIDITSQVSDATTNVNAGGIAGLGSLLTAGCHAEWDEAASVRITSDRTNFGGVAGMVLSGDSYSYLVGCYALCNGRVEIAPNSGSDYTANAGGIAGNFSGYSMIWPVVMEIPAFMHGCYALVESDFAITDGSAKGVAGYSEAAVCTGIYWGSKKGDIGEELAGCEAFASLDQAGFEAAIEQMNAAIANSAIASLVQVSYVYDAAKGIPVLSDAQ